MTMPSCNSASAYLLLTIFLTSYLSLHSGSVAKKVNVSKDENSERPEVTIPQGTLRGINFTTRYHRNVSGFIGIPYAQPPVGDLRFRAPLPPTAWKGTLDAGSNSPPCPQYVDDNGELIGNEDCLHLNVFTPKLPSSGNCTLLPVMIYVMGGRFKTGYNAYEEFGPVFLLDEDVVLVVPNSRLGILGFLTTADEVSPGNYGLKDIVQALKWVHDNIHYFCGNPNQVTLFGGSSGAMSVHLLALSNLTNGLIHKYITQSGTAFSYAVHQPREVCAKRAIQLGKYLGCPTHASILLVNCLRGLNVSQLLNTESLFRIWRIYPRLLWVPTIEPDVEGALLTDTPENLYAAGKIRDLPWMASVTRDEGLSVSFSFYENPGLFQELLENFDFLFPYILEYQDLFDDTKAHTAALKSYYLNDLTADKNLLLANLTKLVSDTQFVYPQYKAFREQLVFAKNPQYLCSFEYLGSYSATNSRNKSIEPIGVSHGDELIYLFGYTSVRIMFPDIEYSQTDLLMVDTMVQLWTSFAKNSKPTTMDSISTTIWEPYSSLNNHLQIGNGPDTSLKMKHNLYSDRMQFCDELFSNFTKSRRVFS